MRITVTLGADVEALIRAAMKERGISFEEVLHSALRAGLAQGKTERSRYAQKTYSLGEAHSFRCSKALAAAAALEDEERDRRNALRK